MKKVVCFSFALLLPTVVNADYIAENEKIFRAISMLEEQLKELELKQKIQKIELEIKEDAMALNAKNVPKPVAPVVKVNTQPIKKPPVRSANVFEPNDVELLYLVGSGLNRSAIVSYKSSNNTLRNNSVFHGWRVSILNNDVALIRGDKRVAL